MRGFNRDVLRPRPGEDAQRHFSDANAGLARSAHHAADDARADVEIAGAVHGHRRGLGHEPRDLVRIHDVPGIRAASCQMYRITLPGGTALTAASRSGTVSSLRYVMLTCREKPLSSARTESTVCRLRPWPRRTRVRVDGCSVERKLQGLRICNADL